MSQNNIAVIKLQSLSLETRWQSSLLCGLLQRSYWEALGRGRSQHVRVLLKFYWIIAFQMQNTEWQNQVHHCIKPDHLLLFRNACSFCRCVALVKPTQELDTYSNLARTTDLQILWRALSCKPCARKTVKAYKVCTPDDMTAWIWSETNRPFVTVTPRIFNTSTCWISVSLDGTEKLCLRCLSTKNNFLTFSQI